MRIILPPPNVTGALHMGHAFEHTLIDVLVRRSRMQGEETVFQPGLDHAGIATQNVVERQLAHEGLTRHQLGREAFLERAWAHKEASASTILSQMQLLETSCDWENLRFTFDEGHQQLTRDSFARLWEDGLISQDERATARCPRCDTSLSDIEVEDGACTRCHTPVLEERSLQWFLHAERLAPLARDAVLEGRIQIDPPSARDEWLRWCEEIGPWCISRQLWWGHRIPIWHGPGGQVQAFTSEAGPPPGWRQDEDVLDTWFSSALWPLTLGEEYPATHLVTGRDLLFFWALRMAMLCLYLTDEVPFEQIHFHGMVRDEHGRKMSKSFGNVIDPVPLIEAEGADTLRLALAHAARPGLDVPFGDGDVKWAKALTRKLRSIRAYAARLPEGGAGGTHLLDEWLLGRLGETTRQVDAALDRFDYAEALDAISRFVEGDVSDTWIEASKARPGSLTTDGTLREALAGVAGLLAPFAPELAFELDASTTWPSSRRGSVHEAEVTAFRAALATIRSERVRRGLGSKESLPASVEGTALRDELVHLGRLDLRDLTDSSEWRFDGLVLRLPTAQTSSGERSRLERELASSQQVLARAQHRLRDPRFLERAPQGAIVEAKRQEQAMLSAVERIVSLLEE